MSLLALLASRSAPVTPPPIVEGALPPLPYVVPSSTPYNVPEYLITPTYDGSGSTVHPDVVDFWTSHGIASWNGYRFWMAHTPYYRENDKVENPSILASHDGVNWEVPPGLTNPIFPAPTDWGFNSDTDLTYDATTDELVLVFRDKSFLPKGMRSKDGVHWPTTLNNIPRPGPSGEMVSPAVVKVPNGYVALAIQGATPRTLGRWTATAPDAPWGNYSVTTGIPSTAWHFDATYHDGRILAVIDNLNIGEATKGGYGEDCITVASSYDEGLTWTHNDTPILRRLKGAWDGGGMYRATLQPHENGTHMRVWYGGSGPASWRVGLTEVPLSEWP